MANNQKGLTVRLEDSRTVIISHAGFSVRIVASLISGGFHLHPENGVQFEYIVTPNNKWLSPSRNERHLSVYLAKEDTTESGDTYDAEQGEGA